MFESRFKRRQVRCMRAFDSVAHDHPIDAALGNCAGLALTAAGEALLEFLEALEGTASDVDPDDGRSLRGQHSVLFDGQ
jgi:hypothetical protein